MSYNSKNTVKNPVRNLFLNTDVAARVLIFMFKPEYRKLPGLIGNRQQQVKCFCSQGWATE